ncbi:hypothetical protein ACTXT7_016012 [Hymenolepis weldensis]
MSSSISRIFTSPNKSSDAKLTNLSRPLFSQSNRDFTSNFVASDSKLSGEEMLTEMEPSRQSVVESGPSRSYSMRFRMDFVYPTVKRDANDEIVPNSVISSQDFNDNFDIINLTQMLEKTTAEAFANEEPTEDFLEGTFDDNKENEERCHDLSPPVIASTSHGLKSMLPSHGVLKPARNLIDESNTSAETEVWNQIEKEVQNMTAVESNPAPQKSLSDGDEYREVRPTPVEGFSGFKTASGSSLKAPSAEARKRAKRLLEEVANSDIQVHKEESLLDILVRDDKSMKPSFGFTTASGGNLKMPSSESLARAKRLVEDCKFPLKESDDIGGLKNPEKHIGPSVDLKGVFKTTIGKYLETACSESFERRKRLLDGATESKKATESVFNSTKEITTQSSDSVCGIQAPKTDSLKQFKRTLEPSTLPKSPLTTIFTTGSDRTLKLSSSESLKESKQLIGGCSKELNTVVVGQGNGEASISSRPNPLQSGFKWTSGKPLNPVSEEEIKRATALFSARVKEPENRPIEAATSNKTVSSLVENEMLHSAQRGFNSASGKIISAASEEAMKRATTPFHECVEEIESGGEPMKIRKSASLVGSGFKLASGKSITPVSNEAMQRATALLNECANETESGEMEICALKSPSLEVSSSSSRKEGNLELSPAFDFDGSFEISSQMINVLEGKISQPQQNTQYLLIEEQRVALRAEQESKAESRFKPVDASNRSAWRDKSHSVSSRASYSKSHQVIHEPPTPGLLWRRQKIGVCSVRDIPISFSGPVDKELNFVGDFLRLENPGPFSLNTASDMRFKVDSDDLHSSYRLGDDVEIIPDSFGYVGCEEVVRWLKSLNLLIYLNRLRNGLATHQWVAHHFCQLAWRFGSTALLHYDNLVRNVFPNLTLPDSSMGRTDGRLLLHALLLELKYRYDRELEAVQSIMNTSSVLWLRNSHGLILEMEDLGTAVIKQILGA